MTTDRTTDANTWGCNPSCCPDGEIEDGCCDEACCAAASDERVPALAS